VYSDYIFYISWHVCLSIYKKVEVAVLKLYVCSVFYIHNAYDYTYTYSTGAHAKSNRDQSVFGSFNQPLFV